VNPQETTIVDKGIVICYGNNNKDGQPAMLARLTYGSARIGISNTYSCLSPTTLAFMREATKVYMNLQGTVNTECIMPVMTNMGDKSITTILASTIADLSESMNALVNSIPSITATNHTDTQAMSNDLWIHRDRLFGESIVWC